MEKLVKPGRLIALALALVVLLSVYASALYELQVVKGSEYTEISENSVLRTSNVAAARGDILDRNGVLLVSSREVYNVGLSRTTLLKNGDANAHLLELINAALANGVSYTDTFPITMSGPFEYLAGMSEQQRTRLVKYMEYFGLDTHMSASELIVWMKDHYGLDYTTSLADARRIIGVRYELELRVIVGIADYVFATDVPVDFVAAILERDLPFVTVETSYEREYHTEYAAQILGYTGRMNSAEIEEYTAKGYPMDAVIGKTGAEQAFEEYLHGIDGSVTVNAGTNGAVLSVLDEVPAQPGSNVYLTIDIGLQAAAERALEDVVATINSQREEDDEKAAGAAAVVIDVKSGDTLAAANYPTYDPAKLMDNYSFLESDPLLPLYNRATQGEYNPGSTFKMVSAYAGLNAKYLDRYFTIKDTGQYTKYPTYQPKCWVYPGAHGELDVVGALQKSCNYFFYKVGDSIGMDAIVSSAEAFGFGEKTGIEIFERAGVLATPDYKRENLGEPWYAADTLLAVIGQSYNQFTPIQLANYVATVANGGTRYKTTLLRQVRSADYSETEFVNTSVVNGTVDNSEGYIDILQEGMEAVTAEGGTAYTPFRGYPVKVAAKTGTVQSDSAAMNNGVFVCYAPADDPEIAVAIVVEKGGSGSALATAARSILDGYFTEPVINYTLEPENTLIK